MPFQIVRNDITKIQVDAIVNTANPSPGYGAGVDTAVYEAAGEKELLAKRQEIGAVAPGTSFITDGYRLPAKHIIHTVGTAWHGGGEGEESVIRDCYRSIFRLAVENDIESLAIPLLASGSYGFPKGIALRIALSEIESFMSENDMALYLVVFDDKSFSLSSELYGDIESYISENYVEEKSLEEYEGFHRAPVAAAAPKPPKPMGRFMRRLSGASVPDFLNRSAKMSEAETFRKNEPEEDLSDAEACEDALFDDEACVEGAGGAPVYAAAVPLMGAKPDRSLDDVINNLDKTFMELVFSFADEKGMTDVEVQKKANLDRKAFSKLKCGTTKNPSKSTALALAVALELSLDDTKDLLSRAGLALSPCSKQDVIVQYFIEREAYDIFEINIVLYEHGEPPLGMQTA
ncbi:MAG: macro domain-containing protein [Lachnospiraceae bacterium]|nr:macro domain-containing protein [Lachnospiraceae bacterium]